LELVLDQFIDERETIRKVKKGNQKGCQQKCQSTWKRRAFIEFCIWRQMVITLARIKYGEFLVTFFVPCIHLEQNTNLHMRPKNDEHVLELMFFFLFFVKHAPYVCYAFLSFN
jgi:hypothetical protein